MAEILKAGKSDAELYEADRKVRETVTAMLDDIRQQGEAAVRELSRRLDRWDPPSFRLSSEQIADVMAQVSPQTLKLTRIYSNQLDLFRLEKVLTSPSQIILNHLILRLSLYLWRINSPRMPRQTRDTLLLRAMVIKIGQIKSH